MVRLALGLTVLLILPTPLLTPVHAQDTSLGVWQAVGGVGVPDESAIGRVFFRDDGWAEIRPDLASASVRLRYDIAPQQALRGNSPFDVFVARLRVRDTGASASVVVKFKRLHIHSGAVRELLRWDSDTAGNIPLPTGIISTTADVLRDEQGFMRTFNFIDYVYWAEVTLVRNAAGGNPGVQVVGLLSVFPS